MRNQLYLSVLISITLNFVYAQQFTPQFTGLGADGITSPYHMVAIDENTLWASASNPNGEKFGDGPNVIVHTEDGGSTWKSDTLPADNPNAFTIACISAISPDSAWVSSIDNTANYPNWDIKIYATFDGGENWQLQNVAFSDNESYAGQIHFFDHLEGMLFAASADGYFQVFKTFDAGNTWDRLPQENFPPLIGNFEGDIDNGYYAIQDTIWVPTSEGRILKSIDRGTTWAAFDTPVPSNVIFEVTFSDS
ncbi:MAG: hypothetical protein KC587_14350, partial [Nitrospira sp.]|nr:hypothetical protein [Nitrospira sp.]